MFNIDEINEEAEYYAKELNLKDPSMTKSHEDAFKAGVKWSQENAIIWASSFLDIMRQAAEMEEMDIEDIGNYMESAEYLVEAMVAEIKRDGTDDE